MIFFYLMREYQIPHKNLSQVTFEKRDSQKMVAAAGNEKYVKKCILKV